MTASDPGSLLTASDREQLREHGIDLDEATSQLERFAEPPAPAALVRPATLGDGIRELPIDDADIESAWREARRDGRLSRFVPASGAASRMFKELYEARQSPRPADHVAARRLIEVLDRLPFRDRVEAEMGGLASVDVTELLDLLLEPSGLGLPELPKGLLPFHRYEDGTVRTAFEEHLAEAVELMSDERGTVSAHFTVSAEHEARFRSALAEVVERLDGNRVDLQVDFSRQRPSTDTLAGDLEGHPFRDDEGRLVLRPGGHGALIGNLEAHGGDIVAVRNIDNVLPLSGRTEADRVRRALLGLTVLLDHQRRRLLLELEEGGDEARCRAVDWIRSELGLDPGDQAGREELVVWLDRPFRVCGMVRNTGEPGGGPFWVHDRERGASLQIVEAAQIDRADARQQEILQRSTHFNPVELVCALRDAHGRPYPLAPWIDDDAWFLARKSLDGRELQALERPGLWNGAMGRWTTVFVETPVETFAPVKTVFDLARGQHQARGGIASGTD